MSYWPWASSCFISSVRNIPIRLFTPAVRLFGSQNETSGAFRLNAGSADVPPHCALISTPLKRVVALKVKSTGCDVFGIVNVVVTGPNVPSVNAGMFTVAFVALTSDSPCNPFPVLIGSTVTDPDPAVIASNWAAPPGRVSVIVSVGVQTPGTGVGVGVGVGLGVGVGVGVGVGLGVGVGVGVGGGPPVHCPCISTPENRVVALKVKSTGCEVFGTVNVAVTGPVTPGVNAGMLITAFVVLTTE